MVTTSPQFDVPGFVITDVLVGAGEIMNVVLLLLPVWLMSPVKAALALARPAFVLLIYATANIWLKLIPVAIAEQGIWAIPL